MSANTVFIGGSRHAARLPPIVLGRLDNVIRNRHPVVIGDANGADKAVQAYLNGAGYDLVTVFCSGDRPRNNVGAWPVRAIVPPSDAQGFQYYAAKDRAMAHAAEFGLMIWDGKSPGTLLNVLRLTAAGKISVLVEVPEARAVSIKTRDHWDIFLRNVPRPLLHDLRKRATPDEERLLEPARQPDFFST